MKSRRCITSRSPWDCADDDAIRAGIYDGGNGHIQQAGAKSAEVSVQSLINELEEARSKATSLNQLSAAVRATAEKARISGLLIERSQIEITGPDPDEPKSVEELYRRMADEKLDGLTNARWLPISDQDRQQLADLFSHWLAAIEDFVDQVNSRPLINIGKAG